MSLAGLISAFETNICSCFSVVWSVKYLPKPESLDVCRCIMQSTREFQKLFNSQRNLKIKFCEENFVSFQFQSKHEENEKQYYTCDIIYTHICSVAANSTKFLQ